VCVCVFFKTFMEFELGGVATEMRDGHTKSLVNVEVARRHDEACTDPIVCKTATKDGSSWVKKGLGWYPKSSIRQ
jgi:hypothetical protein